MQRVFPLLATLLFSSQVLSEQTKFPCDEANPTPSTQPDTVVKLSSFIESKSIERVAPKYPVAAARAMYEGFVQMSFVVDEQGNVLDPVVENFSGHRGFKKEALRAVKQWKYSPAMQDGKPVQQCHQKVQFDFALDGAKGATRAFIRKYRQATDYLEQQNLGEAEATLQAMHKGNLRNRYENAWLWRLDSYLARAKKQSVRELDSVNKALSSAKVGKNIEKILSGKEVLALYQRRFALEVKLMQFADALKTMKRISKLPHSESVAAHLSPYAEQVKTLIGSDDNIFVPGTLKGEDPWFHTLARNKFAFSNIQGVVSDVELRCQSRREKFTVAEDNTWHIPPSWGQCRVMVRGEAGSTFEIVEVSSASS